MNKEEYLKNLKNLNKSYKSQYKGLGKGISALINSKPAIDEPSSDHFKIFQIELDKIVLGKYQSRTIFNEETLQDLSNSIKQKGVLQPVLVKVNKENNNYELIAGERRLRASKMGGLTTIPAIIVDFDTKEALEIGLIENLQRENLNPIEEALAYDKLIKQFEYTHNDLALVIGKSRSYITNFLRILTLPQEIKDLIAAKKLNVGHAKIIVNYECPMELVEDILTKKLSVREVEKLIKEKKQPQEKNNFLDVDTYADIKEKLNNFFKCSDVDIKINKVGNGYIKISFKNDNQLKEIINQIN